MNIHDMLNSRAGEQENIRFKESQLPCNNKITLIL
jgi:hypothetical protein